MYENCYKEQYNFQSEIFINATKYIIEPSILTQIKEHLFLMIEIYDFEKIMFNSCDNIKNLLNGKNCPEQLESFYQKIKRKFNEIFQNYINVFYDFKKFDNSLSNWKMLDIISDENWLPTTKTLNFCEIPKLNTEHSSMTWTNHEINSFCYVKNNFDSFFQIDQDSLLENEYAEQEIPQIAEINESMDISEMQNDDSAVESDKNVFLKEFKSISDNWEKIFAIKPKENVIKNEEDSFKDWVIKKFTNLFTKSKNWLTGNTNWTQSEKETWKSHLSQKLNLDNDFQHAQHNKTNLDINNNFDTTKWVASTSVVCGICFVMSCIYKRNKKTKRSKVTSLKNHNNSNVIEVTAERVSLIDDCERVQEINEQSTTKIDDESFLLKNNQARQDKTWVENHHKTQKSLPNVSGVFTEKNSIKQEKSSLLYNHYEDNTKKNLSRYQNNKNDNCCSLKMETAL